MVGGKGRQLHLNNKRERERERERDGEREKKVETGKVRLLSTLVKVHRARWQQITHMAAAQTQKHSEEV